MSHYQKIATLLVRCTGAIAFTLGLLGLLFGSVLRAAGTASTPEQSERFGSSIWYVALGLVLFLAGRPLGRLLGRGLDQEHG